MKDGTDEVRSARQTRIQLEQLKRRAINYGSSNNSQNDEIVRLQRIIADLQKSKGNMQISNVSAVSNGNSYELEFRLHQAQTRVESLEQELQERAKAYAREIAMYKLKVA